MTPPIIRRLAELRAATHAWQKADEVVGVVPTMGALHDGHLSLVAAAKKTCDRVIVTIFVNPKQFNQASDLDSYPRTEEEDARKLARFEVDAVYAPGVDQIYPDGFSTNVSVTGMTDVLCGTHRPGHFDGVATVVTKLFTQTSANKAFFGEKDFQQLLIIRRMVEDLNMPVAIEAVATVREDDGLAMSSRNGYLSAGERALAPQLYQTLLDVRDMILQGDHELAGIEQAAMVQLREAGFEPQYVRIRRSTDLSIPASRHDRLVVLVAAMLGGTHLIDNIKVSTS